MPVYLAEAGATGGVSLATLDTLIAGIKSAIAWIFSLFARIVSTISTNDLLLYPVFAVYGDRSCHTCYPHCS